MRRLVGLVIALVVLCSCRVDTTVEVTVEDDGSGVVRVVALADRELVERAPGLAGDLRFDDLAAAGWTVVGPEPTAIGGLRVELAHTFSTVAEAEALLASLNGQDGPFVGLTLTRTASSSRSEVVMAGTLRVTGGLDAFADGDLLAAVGATPYADEVAAIGAGLSDVLGVRLRASLPGDVTSAGGESDGGSIAWDVPLDGSAEVLQVSSVHSRDDGRWWRLGANVVLGALIIWVTFAVAFLAYVSLARRRALRRVADHREAPIDVKRG